MDFIQIKNVLLAVLAIVLLFIAFQPPLLHQVLHLYQRLLPNFHGHPYNGRDAYSLESAFQRAF